LETIIHYFENIPSAHRSLLLVGGVSFFWLLEGFFPLIRFDYKKWTPLLENLLFKRKTILISFSIALLLINPYCLKGNTDVDFEDLSFTISQEYVTILSITVAPSLEYIDITFNKGLYEIYFANNAGIVSALSGVQATSFISRCNTKYY